ncbi:hypothetical protein LTR56_026075 [Elasticomyces elasticus]|nr:hypothetical protein LTR56_026075 [Elasticomyces elasticus]KAK3621848.1 hypothetical protein LTR22_025028 [Elasticomyces elasticus]KAK4908143.1 hypothetical protein LTR49_022922 [Elasticomyces elasticus]KAK5748175.1 hypothetical protein LTS12_021775 [Elasticomyces elasticus]
MADVLFTKTSGVVLVAVIFIGASHRVIDLLSSVLSLQTRPTCANTKTQRVADNGITVSEKKSAPLGSITDEQRRRFQRALKTLGLKVYLHPSQAHAYAVTPDLSLEESSDEESGSDDTKDATGGEWPRLLLLVKSA